MTMWLEASDLFVHWPYKKCLKIPKGYQKTRQQDGQRKEDEKTNNDLQNITPKAKYRETRTPLKTGDEHMCSRMVGSSCSTSATHRVDTVISQKASGLYSIFIYLLLI
jgi:hypothetical protein